MRFSREVTLGNVLTILTGVVAIVFWSIRMEARQDRTDERLATHIIAADAQFSKTVSRDADEQFRQRVLEQLQHLREDVAAIKGAQR